MNRIAQMVRLMLLVMAVVSSLDVTAQTNDNPQDLPKNDLQANREEYQREDLELNIAYRKLMPRLNEASRERLKTAQVAWLKFRDLQCDFERGTREGDSVQKIQHKSCLAATTRKRTGELLDWLKELGRN